MKCSANQLANIEYFNPYLTEDTNDLWKKHALRQFRGKKPQEMESWKEMYEVSLEGILLLNLLNIDHLPLAEMPARRTGSLVQSNRIDKGVPANLDPVETNQISVYG